MARRIFAGCVRPVASWLARAFHGTFGPPEGGWTFELGMGWFDDNHPAGEAHNFGMGYMYGGGGRRGRSPARPKATRQRAPAGHTTLEKQRREGTRAATFTAAVLDEMSYRELQACAKDRNLKAISKAIELKARLAALLVDVSRPKPPRKPEGKQHDGRRAVPMAEVTNSRQRPVVTEAKVGVHVHATQLPGATELERKPDRGASATPEVVQQTPQAALSGQLLMWCGGCKHRLPAVPPVPAAITAAAAALVSAEPTQA